MLRKEAVAAISVFLTQEGTLVQSYLLLMLLLLFILLTIKLRPYSRPLLTFLELLSLSALLLTVFAWAFFLSSRPESSPYFKIGKDCKSKILIQFLSAQLKNGCSFFSCLSPMLLSSFVSPSLSLVIYESLFELAVAVSTCAAVCAVIVACRELNQSPLSRLSLI